MKPLGEGFFYIGKLLDFFLLITKSDLLTVSLQGFHFSMIEFWQTVSSQEFVHFTQLIVLNNLGRYNKMLLHNRCVATPFMA